MLRNALRIARDKVIVMDIWPGFEPNDMMLSGEPYVLDYLANIEDDVQACLDVQVCSTPVGAEGEFATDECYTKQWEVEAADVVDKHVRMWRFTRVDWGI